MPFVAVAVRHSDCVAGHQEADGDIVVVHAGSVWVDAGEAARAAVVVVAAVLRRAGTLAAISAVVSADLVVVLRIATTIAWGMHKQMR